MRTAEAIAERSRGDFNPEYITQTNSVAVPIIERLSPEEQLHFVFYHDDKGFRIFEPDGEERTPDHISMTDSDEGKRFLLISDERILYIVGKEQDIDDKVQEFSYDQIISIEGYGTNEIGPTPTIEFGTVDGRRYKFVQYAFYGGTVENAAKYVNSQINSEITGVSEDHTREHTAEKESTQATSITDSSEVRFCSDCGAEVAIGDGFCSECGAPAEDNKKNRNTIKQSGTNFDRKKTSNTNTSGWKNSYSLIQWIASVTVALITFPLGTLVPIYFYFKGSKGTGADQTPLEAWTVILTNLIGIVAVEIGGRGGAKTIWYIFAFFIFMLILLII